MCVNFVSKLNTDENLDFCVLLGYIISMPITDKSICNPKVRLLDDLVRVQPGYFSRGKVRSTPNGTHFLIQARDVSPESGISLDLAIRFKPERKAELYQVFGGDILLTARGQAHGAYLVSHDLADTLVSSVFYILRPNPQVIRPAYLAWWLNLPDVQARIQGHSRGTGIGYMSRQALEQLSVCVPLLEVQVRIEQVVALWQKKQQLQARLDSKREQFIQTLCKKAVLQTQE